MTLLGALEHGIYVDNEDDDECLGMSPEQIRQFFGIERDSDDDDEVMSAEEERMQHLGDIDDEDSVIDDTEEDFGDEDPTSDDAEDWLAYISEGEDEGVQEEEHDTVCLHRHFIGISFMKQFSRFLPLIALKVESTTTRSPSQSIPLPLKNSLTFIKFSLPILNF